MDPAPVRNFLSHHLAVVLLAVACGLVELTLFVVGQSPW